MAEERSDPSGDLMQDFLDELDLTPTPQQEPRKSVTTEVIDNLLADTDGCAQETMTAVKKEIPKAALAQEIRLASPESKPKKSTPPRPKALKIPKSNSASPKANTLSPVPTRGGMTMYERSVLQIQERGRKLKTLQDKLMEDCTFTPKSSNSDSRNFSRETSPAGDVFDRLYAADTAATRGQRASSPKPAASTPTSRVRRKSLDNALTPGSRIDVLYEAGQQSVRSRVMTVKEEEETRRRRYEEEQLGTCTFRPQTTWHLAKERRKKAREAAEREAEEVSKSPRLATPLSEREKRKFMYDELQLKHCTFKPKTKWDLIGERRKMATGGTIWDDDDDAGMPLEVTTTPSKAHGSSMSAISPLHDPLLSNTKKRHSLEKGAQTTPESGKLDVQELKKRDVKLVSTDKFQEESGKNTEPGVVRSQYMGSITPSTPEWKRKYAKIGAKNLNEGVVEGTGHALSETMQVRGSSTIVAGGNKITPTRTAKPLVNVPREKAAKMAVAEEKASPPQVEKKVETEDVGGFKVAERAEEPKSDDSAVKAEEEAPPEAQEGSGKKKKKQSLKDRLMVKKADKQNKKKEGDPKVASEEEEARLRAEKEAKLNAKEEARLKVEEARLRAEKEAKLKAEEESRLKVEEEARLKAEKEAKRKAEEEARLKT
jgi:hypothetical protein